MDGGFRKAFWSGGKKVAMRIQTYDYLKMTKMMSASYDWLLILLVYKIGFLKVGYNNQFDCVNIDIFQFLSTIDI